MGLWISYGERIICGGAQRICLSEADATNVAERDLPDIIHWALLIEGPTHKLVTLSELAGAAVTSHLGASQISGKHL